jgi:ubiquinone/menaquinone biosynthesis C-methylase UbiE
MAAEELFDDLRLASVYEQVNPPLPYEDYYVGLAAALKPPATILDMGCGTGRITCRLAALGHRVTGADPARGMLQVARAKPEGRRVTWVDATATSLASQQSFDLIIMTGHAFQILHSDEDIAAALVNLRRHLKREGMLVFETRNRACREWDGWQPHLTREECVLADGSRLVIHNSIAADDLPFVTYRTHFRFGDEPERVTEATLRFTTAAELSGLLATAGLTRVTWAGNWDGSPLAASAPEIIVHARP